MRTFKTPLLVAALVGLAAAPGMARAASPDRHLITVRLPDGMTAQIQYTGNIPPRIMFGAPAAAAAFVTPGDPFTLLRQISADMDRQAAAMFQSVNNLMLAPAPGFGGPTEAVLGAPPAGGLCARSVQITTTGNGQPPRVVTRTEGQCGPASGAAAPTALPAMPQPATGPAPIEVRNGGGAKPYQRLVQTVDWRH